MQKLSNYIADFRILRRRVYTKNLNDITFEDASRRISNVIISMTVIGFIVGIFIGATLFGVIEKTKEHCEMNLDTKYDSAIGDIQWKDSVFAIYKNQADLYLSQEKFKGTPLNGEILALAARNAYDSTGILVPICLALAQAQWESAMGTMGRSPIKNPYNIGEHDSGTVLYFETTFDGVQAYYYLMCKKYLSCKSLNELFTNFTNCNGNRYASNESYEQTIKTQYFQIQKWIKDNYKSYNYEN